MHSCILFFLCYVSARLLLAQQKQQSKQTMNILSLPQDLVSVILLFLPVRDVGRCKRCCLLFQAAASDETLWMQLLQRDLPWADLKPFDSAEGLYKALSGWSFEPTSAVKFSKNYTEVGPAIPSECRYLVPHARRIMTTGVHAWEIVIRSVVSSTFKWYFVGVGTHASASCGGYKTKGSTCVDENAYVLGFDGHQYHSAQTRGQVAQSLHPGCYGLVLDCNKLVLHYFLDGKYLGHMPVPAEPLVAIVEVGADYTASIRAPSRDYTYVTRRTQ